MSQSSLEMCTESLGSETGSCDFSDEDRSGLNSSSDEEILLLQGVELEDDSKQLMSVNYQCSVSRRSPKVRSFPPPLPSITRRDGTCIKMRSRRHDDRLVVDALPVSSRNYLHARRQNGRLLLSFIDSTATNQPPAKKKTQELNDQQEIIKKVEPDQYQEEEEEEEEEVEVLDRGAMVEVKVSTQLQQSGSAKKVLRSSLVINKFVGGTPLTNQNQWVEPPEKNYRTDLFTASQSPLSPQRRLTATTSITTAAAAAVAASSASTSSEVVGHKQDSKLLFTSKRRNREEMLHYMQRCSQLRRPLFFREAGCIATSS